MSIDTGTTSPETQGSHLHELEKAVMSARRAYEFRALPDSLQSESESLDNLAGTLWERFEQEGEIRDLEEAISLYRQVLEHRPPQNPLRPNSLNNLSKVLLRRWSDYGYNPRDVDEAILLPKQALEIQSPTHDHPSLSESLNNLALALWTRFRQGGQPLDLDKAISMHRQALELRVSPHPSLSESLNNLALALWTRFRQRGQPLDLDEAISMQRQALEQRASSLTPSLFI